MSLLNDLSNFKLKIGDFVEKINNQVETSCPGIKPFNRGHYKIVDISEGIFSKDNRKLDNYIYVLQKCTKNGNKLFNQKFHIYVPAIHKMIDSNEIIKRQ